MTLIRHRISRDEGVAAVEFALILPVLALLLFGVLEFGRVSVSYTHLTLPTIYSV